MRRNRMAGNERFDLVHLGEVFDNIEDAIRNLAMRLAWNGKSGLVGSAAFTYDSGTRRWTLPTGLLAIAANGDPLYLRSSTTSGQVPVQYVTDETAPFFLWAAVDPGKTASTTAQRVKWVAGAEQSFSGLTRYDDTITFTASETQPPATAFGNAFFQVLEVTGWDGVEPEWEYVYAMDSIDPEDVFASGSIADLLNRALAVIATIKGQTWWDGTTLVSLATAYAALIAIRGQGIVDLTTAPSATLEAIRLALIAITGEATYTAAPDATIAALHSRVGVLEAVTRSLNISGATPDDDTGDAEFDTGGWLVTGAKQLHLTLPLAHGFSFTACSVRISSGADGNASATIYRISTAGSAVAITNTLSWGNSESAEKAFTLLAAPTPTIVDLANRYELVVTINTAASQTTWRSGKYAEQPA